MTKLLLDDDLLDAQLIRAVGATSHQGADLGEVVQAVRGLDETDLTAWYEAWNALGERTFELGEQQEAGIPMLATRWISDEPRDRDFAGELLLAPPSAAGSAWIRRFRRAQQGFASGWMQIRGNRRRRNYDRGFVVSDHADWPALLRTVRETGARRVIATHGATDALVRALNEDGIATGVFNTDFGGED